MKKMAITIASILISAMLAATALADSWNQQDNGYKLSTATSTPATVYQPGRYEAGVSIPAGEYVMLSLNDALSSSYQIHTRIGPGAANTLVEHCNFDYNVILTLEQGQTLTFSNCTASPLSEIPLIDHSKGQGYMVGFQIPAGTYRLGMDWADCVYYISSRPSASAGSLTDYAFLSDDSYVTVKDGEYLLLVGCLLEEYLGLAEVPKDHIPLSDGYDLAASYQPGIYQAGTDIPAGDYILFIMPDRIQGQESHYQIQGLEEYLRESDQVIDVALITPEDNAHAVHLEDGNILTMSNCVAFQFNP